MVMRDGRVVWNEPNVGVQQGRLSPEGVAWVQEQLDATGLLDKAGSFDAEVRPGTQPPGGGAVSYDFTVSSPSGPVRVTAGIPGNADERYWIVPEELRTLTDLGGRMMDADAWVPANLWLEGARPYVPQQYLLLVTLNPDRAADAIDPRAVVDVDRVLWPVPGSIDTVTPAALGANDPRARCAVLDAGMAELVDAAQRAQGLPGEPRPPFADRAYLWKRGGGYLTIEFQALLPDEHDCLPAQFALD